MIAGAVLLAALAAAKPARAAAPAPAESYGASVIGIVASFQRWDEQRPWMKSNPGARRGSGVVVDGPAILTTAEIVADATLLQVEKFGRASHVEAHVIFEDRECNLALLGVDEPGFFDGLEPVKLAAASPTEGTLRTVRWSSQQLEAAASRVKRIEVSDSWFGALEHAFLLVQTDLNAGGWAEPVFSDGRLVGLTVSQQHDQRARVLPVEIISRFLERARHPETYRPFPVVGVKWQANEDRALAAWLGQTGPPAGVVVRQVPWGSSGCGVLEPLDILLSIDGLPVDPNGFVTHPRFGRLEFPEILVERHAIGDVVPVRVLRHGKTLDLKMTLRDYPAALDLIPVRRGDDPPPYAIEGGLIFRELDADFLRSFGKSWYANAPLALTTLFALKEEAQSPGHRRIIVLTGVLPSEYNVGYQNLSMLAVASVNGKPVDSIAGLVDAFKAPQDGLQTVDFTPNAGRHEIVLDAATFEEASRKILETYDVPQAVRLPAAPPPDPGPTCPGEY